MSALGGKADVSTPSTTIRSRTALGRDFAAKKREDLLRHVDLHGAGDGLPVWNLQLGNGKNIIGNCSRLMSNPAAPG
jgi:hypothetical protein